MKKILGVGALFGAAGAANAAPPDISAFTSMGADITTMGTDLFATFGPVIAGIVILQLAIRLGKKFANKAG